MLIIQENDDKTKQIYQEMRTCFLSVGSLVELHFQTKRAIDFQPPMKDKGQPTKEHSNLPKYLIASIMLASLGLSMSKRSPATT